MGVSVVVAMTNRMSKSDADPLSEYVHIIKRSVLLLLLSWWGETSGGTDIDDMRIPGVLSRFAVSYFVAANLVLGSLQETMASPIASVMCFLSAGAMAGFVLGTSVGIALDVPMGVVVGVVITCLPLLSLINHFFTGRQQPSAVQMCSKGFAGYSVHYLYHLPEHLMMVALFVGWIIVSKGATVPPQFPSNSCPSPPCCNGRMCPPVKCPTGYLGPGGLHEGGNHFNCTGGIARYIDNQVFGPSHMWGGNFPQPIYHNTAIHEPEGFLGTLNSIVLTWFGVICGRLLKYYNSIQWKLTEMAISGFVLLLLTGILTGFHQFGGVCLNQPLCTF